MLKFLVSVYKIFDIIFQVTVFCLTFVRTFMTRGTLAARIFEFKGIKPIKTFFNNTIYRARKSAFAWLAFGPLDIHVIACWAVEALWCFTV